MARARDETDGREATAGTCACGNFKPRARKECGECQGFDYTLTPEQQRIADLATKECFGDFREASA